MTAIFAWFREFMRRSQCDQISRQGLEKIKRFQCDQTFFSEPATQNPKNPEIRPFTTYGQIENRPHLGLKSAIYLINSPNFAGHPNPEIGHGGRIRPRLVTLNTGDSDFRTFDSVTRRFSAKPPREVWIPPKLPAPAENLGTFCEKIASFSHFM